MQNSHQIQKITIAKGREVINLTNVLQQVANCTLCCVLEYHHPTPHFKTCFEKAVSDSFCKRCRRRKAFSSSHYPIRYVLSHFLRKILEGDMVVVLPCLREEGREPYRKVLFSGRRRRHFKTPLWHRKIKHV